MKPIILLLLLLVPAAVLADVWVVRPDGQGTIPNIQAAVDASADGDEIWLMDGVFQGPGNRDIDLRDRNIVIKSFYDDPAACIIDCGPAGGAVYGITTIISGTREGGAILAWTAVPLTISCSNFYGNEGGDWTAPFAAQVDERGNFSANPCYCGPEFGDFQLSADSYARADGHPWGCDERVGAFGVGCGAVGCSGPVPTESRSFGSLKALYR